MPIGYYGFVITARRSRETTGKVNAQRSKRALISFETYTRFVRCERAFRTMRGRQKFRCLPII